MNIAFYAAGIATLLAGCAAPTSADLARRDTLSICTSYGVFKNGGIYGHMLPPMRAELDLRAVVSSAEWSLIDRGAIQIGMSQCALYASWGSADRENRSVGSGGVRIQHVYRSGYRYIKANYVYTENGRVTSWQD